MKKYLRENYAGRYILAFIITNFIFVFIFLLIYSINYSNYNSIYAQNNIISDYLKEMTNYLNKSDIYCDIETLVDSSKKLDLVGSRINLIEKRFGKYDTRVLEQKNKYHELEFKHSQMIKQINFICNRDIQIIYYFYSNFDKDSINNKFSLILNLIKKENTENLMIYSFDFNLNSSFLEDLKQVHKINNTPILIVNDERLISVSNIRDLRKVISQTHKQ